MTRSKLRPLGDSLMLGHDRVKPGIPTWPGECSTGKLGHERKSIDCVFPGAVFKKTGQSRYIN